MHEIRPKQLWIGNAFDIRDPRKLFDAGIAAVVDLAFEEASAQLPRPLIYCRIPLNDGGGNPSTFLRLAIQTTVELLRSRIPTIIACSAGMSRSPTIAAWALGAVLETQAEIIIQQIAEIRSLEVKGILWNDCIKAMSESSNGKLET